MSVASPARSAAPGLWAILQRTRGTDRVVSSDLRGEYVARGDERTVAGWDAAAAARTARLSRRTDVALSSAHRARDRAGGVVWARGAPIAARKALTAAARQRLRHADRIRRHGRPAHTASRFNSAGAARHADVAAVDAPAASGDIGRALLDQVLARALRNTLPLYRIRPVPQSRRAPQPWQPSARSAGRHARGLHAVGADARLWNWRWRRTSCVLGRCELADAAATGGKLPPRSWRTFESTAWFLAQGVVCVAIVRRR